MREFAKNCDIDLTKQVLLDEADIVIRDRLNDRIANAAPLREPRTGEGFMFDDPAQNELFNPDGNGDKYLGPEQVVIQRKVSQNIKKQQTQKLAHQNSQNMARKLVKDQQSSQLLGVIAQSLQQQVSGQKLGTQLSRIPSMNNLSRQGTQNIKQQQTMKSANFGQQNTLGGLSQINKNADMSMRSFFQEPQVKEQVDREKPSQYIKIGDTILLTMKIQVFQQDIEYQQLQKMKEEAVVKDKIVYQDEDNMGASLKLNRIIDDPLFTYKGVVMCEGINNLNLQVLPKVTEEDTQNATSQFLKCLFCVETKFAIQNMELIQEKVIERNKAQELKRKAAEKGDYQAMSQLDQTLKEFEDELSRLEKQKAIEDTNNMYMTNQRQGTKVQYGEQVQLRHVFTGKYLSIDVSEMSGHQGTVKVSIQGLSPNSWISFIPARNQQNFISEMLISSKDSKKFNLKIGGQINVKDSFYLLNRNQETHKKYFLYVDKSLVSIPNGVNHTFDVTAGLNPTKFNSRMFLAQGNKQKDLIYSGDVVRLLHIESGCYIQTGTKLSGSRSMFSQYPDFLQAEISEQKNITESWEGDFKTLNYGKEESIDFDDSDVDEQQKKENKENEIKMNKNLYLETEARSQSFTNSCFEIQNVDAFVGGEINLNQPFRLKQTVTDMFVALDPEGLFLTLRSDPLQQRSTIFSANSISIDEKQLKTGSELFIKTNNQTYVQIYQDVQDQIDINFKYKDFSPYEFYNQQNRGTTLSIVAGKKQPRGSDSEQKLIFKIEKVDQDVSKITYECSSFLQKLCDFWEFLNQWAVVKNERAEALYQSCYDGDAAVLQEDLLQQKAENMTKVMQNIISMLQKAAQTDDKLYQELQKNLAQQKIGDCIMFVIELIYYKTVPPEFRNKPFKPDRFLKHKIFDLSHESFLMYQIAKDHLDDLNLLLLKTIMLLIRYNPINCESLSKYADVLFNQFRRQPNPFEEIVEGEYVKKIFCHMYKVSTYIYNDRSSIIKSAEGINQNMPEVITKTLQLSRWLNLLETVQYTDNSNQNILQQIRYYKVLAAFCKTVDKLKFKFYFQLQIVQKLFHMQANVPLWVGTQRRTDKSLRPFIYFARLQGESSETFLQMNQHIAACCGQSLNQETDRKFDVVFNIDELTIRYDDFPKHIAPYFYYISSVILLYAAICGGRNREAISFVRQRIGASDTFLIDQCTSTHRQAVIIVSQLKPAYLHLIRVLILDHVPFSAWSDLSKNRVFIWSELPNAELHNTIYQWEKVKYGDEKTNTYGTDEQQIRKSTLQIRQIITDFIEQGPVELLEFLYSSEKKSYSDTMVNPKVQVLTSYFETAISVLKSENTDSTFMLAMMDLAVQIMLAISSVEFIDFFQDSWIYKFIRVIHKVPECKVKEQKIVLHALEILKVISSHRLTSQMLTFLKSFKDFEEDNKFSHVNFDNKEIDLIFKNLFTIQQFNIETKSLQILFLMLDPTRKILADIYEEQAYEEDKARRQKLRAIQTKRIETPRSQTARNLDGVVEDASFQLTKRSTQRLKTVNLKQNEDSVVVFNPKEQKTINEQITALLSTDEQKKAATTNRDLPIDEYLLYFGLMRTHLRQIPIEALRLVYECAFQRQILLNSLATVELLVSEDDVNNYKTIHFLKERLTLVSQRLVQEEFTYLFYKVGQQEQMKDKISECSNVFKQLGKLIESQPTKLARFKIQNIVRQIDFIDVIFNKLLKTLYFDHKMHKELFNNAMEFLFQFSYHNTQTSKKLIPHLSYLVELTKFEVETAKVLAAVIQNEKLTSFGMKFHQYIIRKLTVEKSQTPQLYDYLNVVSQNEPVLQQFFLTQIIQDFKFRNRLYMQKNNEREKIEIVKELVRKRLIYGKGNDGDLAKEILNLNLHVSSVNFLAQCAVNNVYGLKQVRILIDLEVIMDALLAQSVPFVLKISYFRLFYVGFLQQIGNQNSISLSYTKFLQLIRFVILVDIETFYEYYNGLIVPYPAGMGEEAINDPEWKRSKQRITIEFERQTKETSDKENARKSFKQKNDEKEMRAQLSPLNEGSRPYPFLEEKNMVEYWTYLCSMNKETGKLDGLLIFIKDLYKTIMTKQDLWVDELKDSSVKLYNALLLMTDQLDNLREMYKQYIIPLDNLMIAVSEATSCTPSSIKTINNQDENLDYQDEKEDEQRIERITVIVRDFIISKNLAIRDGFDIKSLTQDVMVHPYQIKRKLKDICGNDVDFNDIELMVRKIMNSSKKKQELQAVVGIELGQPGHIRTRFTAELHEKFTRQFRSELDQRELDNYKDETELFNFKEFEIILKSKLQKAGFKPPIQRRERVIEEKDFIMVMEQADLSHGCQSDLQHFIKCYWEFLNRYKNADEIQDLAKKILQKFNLLFIQGSKQNESSIDLVEYTKFKQFMRNLVRVVLVKVDGDPDLRTYQFQIMANDSKQSDMIDRNNFLVCLISQIVLQLNPNNFEKEIRHSAQQRHKLLQRIMTQCGMLGAAYSFINPDQPDEIVSQALRLVYALIDNENKEVLQSLLVLVKEDSYNLLVILRSRIRSQIDILLKVGVLNRSMPEKTLKEKIYDLPVVAKDDDLVAQPYYLPDGWTIENKLQREQPVLYISELIFILKLCQALTNGLSEFQEILSTQDKPEQIDLLEAIGESLIRITEKYQERIYDNIKVQQIVETLFQTLYYMADGNNFIQQKFAKWKALLKTLNFFIQINFVYYSADSPLARNKIKILNLSLNFLTLCVNNQENLESIITEINMNNLKTQLITIFKFKIAGTPHREHVFRTNKTCNHQGFCLPNEYCFFQCLVKFDALTFDCASDLFYILLQANLLLPIEKLGKIRFNKNGGKLFLIGRKKYLNQMYWESFERIQEQLEVIQSLQDHQLNALQETQELNHLLEIFFVVSNHNKIERRYFRPPTEQEFGEDEAQELFKGIDIQPKLAEKDRERIELMKILKAQSEYVKEEEEDFEYEEIFYDLIKKSSKPPSFLSRYCCQKIVEGQQYIWLRQIFCCPSLHKLRKQKAYYAKQSDRIKNLLEKRKLIQKKEGKAKIDHFISNRQIEIARKREFLGPFTGSLTKQVLQTTSYMFDQFKYDYVYRFMLSQMSFVEVVNKEGNITKEFFQIPSYCMFFNKNEEHEIIQRLTSQHHSDNSNKMIQFLNEMPVIKLKMQQNQAIARVSPILFKFSQQHHKLTQIILFTTVILNLIFLSSYTYRFDAPPPPVEIVDPQAWVKEVFNYKGYKRWEPAPIAVIQPYIIRMKQPQLGFFIDLISIMNAVAAIFAFFMKQISQNPNQQIILNENQIKEDSFTTGSLASQLPKNYLKQQNQNTNRILSYTLNLITNKIQMKNLCIIVLTSIGLINQDSVYPFILAFLIFSEISIVQELCVVLYRRLKGLIILGSFAFMLMYFAAYYRFLTRQCMEVTECFEDLLRGMIDLPGSSSWLNFSLVLFCVMILFTLFLGLVIDSIAEIRVKKQMTEKLLLERCFICDLHRNDFESKKLDFKEHIENHHNPMAYLFYLMWVTDQNEDSSQMSKLTKTLQDQIKNGQIDFIPLGQCKAIAKK